MADNIRLAAQKIQKVAQKLQARSDARGTELLRYAQMLNDLGDGQSYMPPVYDMLNSAQGAPDMGYDPSQDVQNMANSAGGNPKIESFVAQKNRPDNKVQHVLTVTITAPDNLSESKMMNYILGITELGAEPSNFSWTRKEQKVNQIS